MMSQPSSSGSQGSGRPSVSAPDDLGYVYFNREPTIAELHEYLGIDRAQVGAIVANFECVLQRPSNSALCRLGTRIRRQEVCADVIENSISLDKFNVTTRISSEIN
jgi:hypothetical protein